MQDEYDDFIDEMPSEKIVNGFLQNQTEIEASYDRSSFSNFQVSEHLDAYFRFFGTKDMDVIYLYFLSKKRQDDLIEILSKTQPAISYDVSRIRKQMQFVARLISFLDEFIMFIVDERKDLTTHERQLLTVFLFSTSIVKTAKILELNHITCRTHLLNAIDKLKQLGFMEHHNFFKYIYANLNKVKKVIE